MLGYANAKPRYDNKNDFAFFACFCVARGKVLLCFKISQVSVAALPTASLSNKNSLLVVLY